MYKADQNDITRLVASALDLASEKPLTMGEFAESILQSYMDQNLQTLYLLVICTGSGKSCLTRAHTRL